MFSKLLDGFTLMGLLKTFNSEVIIDSWEDAKIVRRDRCVHFTRFPPLVSFYITVVQYQNQEVDTGRCIVLHHFITRV